MDQLKYEAFCQSLQAPPQIHETSLPTSSKRSQVDDDDCVTARKLQKAGREKLRRDRLNEQFAELGNVLDPERPKNDKATIIGDTVHLLKDLTAQVNKLKAEYDALTEESIELTQEKNDLREEKASIKADIDSLNAQYQRTFEAEFRWPAMDHSVMMASPSYPFPMPMAIPPSPFPMHPSMQIYPFYGNQIPAVLPDPCSSFIPYLTPNNLVEQHSSRHVSLAQPGGNSHISGQPHSDNNSLGESKNKKSEDSNDVSIDLELKTPGSRANRDISSGKRKSYNNTEVSSSSGCSSSRSKQDSSSNSIIGKTRPTREKDKRKS